MVASSPTAGAATLAAWRSQAKKAIAAAATGTKRALTSPCSRSARIGAEADTHRKSASIMTATCSLAGARPWQGGESRTTVAPNSQNQVQYTARIGRNNAGRDVTWPTTAIE